MFSLLRHSLLSVLVLACCSLNEAGETGSALDALTQFLQSDHLEDGEEVFGMVGFYGAPGPPQWLILSSMAKEKALLRESVFARGNILAERKFRKLPGQDLPHLEIEVSRLQIDSDEAFAIAEKMAISRKVAFDSVHYQLRCREEKSEPVWMLSLINPAQVAVGVVYLSAVSGEVLRESWPYLPVERHAPPLTRN